MAVTYHKPLRQIAYRVGALRGSVPAGVDISYVTTPLTASDFRGGPSLDMCKDALLLAEEQIAQTIAETGEHPWRAYLASQTANLASKAALPSVDSASKPIIGIWGAVSDSTDNIICVEMPLDMVKRRSANANTQFRVPVYWFNITGRYITHTRTNVRIEVCTYDRATQSTAVDNNSNMLLPDTLEAALVCGALATFGDPLGDKARYYAELFNSQMTAIRKGLSTTVAVAA